jgi:hypothetical protein
MPRVRRHEQKAAEQDAIRLETPYRSLLASTHLDP